MGDETIWFDAHYSEEKQIKNLALKNGTELALHNLEPNIQVKDPCARQIRGINAVCNP